MTLTAGAKLGSFQVLSQIGAGGMGEVEAHWRRPNRQPKSRAERGISC
jgi:hypothetical protein